MVLTFRIALVVIALHVIHCHSPSASTDQKGDGGHAAGHGAKHNPMRDTKHIHDTDHIKEHLQEVVDVQDDQLNEGNMQFHYFKVHDSDGDDKLDGIELANAMSHYHDEENGGKEADYSEEEIASMVDQILEEDDTNNDGYIDYPEFVRSQERTD